MTARYDSGFRIEVFYDGDCPLCSREMESVVRRDKHDRIRTTNIAAPDFDAISEGLGTADLMARIHGRLPDGVIVEGVEVFRHIYSALGWSWLMPITRAPGIRQALDVGYDLFARNRLRLTNRCADDSCGVKTPGVIH